MSVRRQLHFGAFMRPASIHTWRYPGAWPDMNFNLAHMKESIRKLEHAKFDGFFDGRPHGGAECADRCTQEKPYHDLVRAVHAVVGLVAGNRAHWPCRHRLDHL